MKKELLNMIKKNKGAFLRLSIYIILSTLFSIALPYLNGVFIDVISAQIDFDTIKKFSIVVLILGLVNVGFVFFSSRLENMLFLQLSYKLKKEMLIHLRKIPILKYKLYNPAYLNQRIEHDINAVIHFFIGNYVTVFLNGLKLIILIIILFQINPYIAYITVFFVPIYFGAYVLFKKNLYAKNLQMKETQNIYYNVFNGQFELMEEVKLEAAYDVQNQYLEEHYMQYHSAFKNYISTAYTFSSVDGVISLFFQITTFLYGGYEVINGNMTIGQLTIVNTYFLILLQCIKYYFELGKTYQNTIASYKRMEELFTIEIEQQGTGRVDHLTHLKADISFQYSDRSIFQEYKLDLSPGEITVVVGENGTGKTTLSKILVGLYKSDDCKVYYNDIDIGELDMIAVRHEKIAYIGQLPRFHNKLVKDLFWDMKEGINPDNISDALAEIGLRDQESILGFIKKYWDTSINHLSGGEKQRMAIIRSLIKNPDMIIFDEPTSNLDKENMNWFKEILVHLKNGRIIMMITHDKQLLEFGDRMVYLSA